MVVVALIICAVLGSMGQAWAVTDSGSGTFLDALGTKSYRLITLVIVPLIATCMVVFFGVNYYFGVISIGQGLTRLFISIGFIAGGVSMLLGVVGGNMAQAVILL